MGATERARTASARPLEMDYPLFKLTHVTCVVLSYSGFFLRGVWIMAQAVFLYIVAVALTRDVLIVS